MSFYGKLLIFLSVGFFSSSILYLSITPIDGFGGLVIIPIGVFCAVLFFIGISLFYFSWSRKTKITGSNEDMTSKVTHSINKYLFFFIKGKNTNGLSGNLASLVVYLSQKGISLSMKVLLLISIVMLLFLGLGFLGGIQFFNDLDNGMIIGSFMIGVWFYLLLASLVCKLYVKFIVTKF